MGSLIREFEDQATQCLLIDSSGFWSLKWIHFMHVLLRQQDEIGHRSRVKGFMIITPTLAKSACLGERSDIKKYSDNALMVFE